MGTNFAKVYARQDLTYEERVKDRALKAELQQRRATENNLNLVIRNGKIIDKTIRSNEVGN
jgi:hypothetical protein